MICICMYVYIYISIYIYKYLHKSPTKNDPTSFHSFSKPGTFQLERGSAGGAAQGAAGLVGGPCDWKGMIRIIQRS